MKQLPKPYLEFRDGFPEQSDPLDDTTRQLAKLALSIGAGNEGAVHSHTRRALQAGATQEEIFHVLALAVTSIGFPPTVKAYTWITDELKGK